MTAEELLKRLDGLGLAVDRRTLNRYIKLQLVTAPEQRTGGKGVKADYPDVAVAEAAAAAELMKQERWRKEAVKQARALYLASNQAPGIDPEQSDEDLMVALQARMWLSVFTRYSYDR